MTWTWSRVLAALRAFLRRGRLEAVALDRWAEREMTEEELDADTAMMRRERSARSSEYWSRSRRIW